MNGKAWDCNGDLSLHTCTCCCCEIVNIFYVINIKLNISKYTSSCSPGDAM